MASLWDYYKKPMYYPHPEHITISNEGWIDFTTGEILVCIPDLYLYRDDLVANMIFESGDNILLEGPQGDEPSFLLI